MPEQNSCEAHSTGCWDLRSILGFSKRPRSTCTNQNIPQGSIPQYDTSVLEKRTIHPQFCCVYEELDSETFWDTANIDQLPLYAEDRKDDVYRPEVLETIELTVKSLDEDLRKLSLDIHEHPEIMFKEHYAHDTLTKFMENHGFAIKKHYKLPTAWRATFTHGKGGRVLGVNSEMDALPGIGHACGHNLIAVAGVAVALAVREAIVKHDIPGTVVLLGTPAEEGGLGKQLLIDEGAYKGMDACIMCHPTPGPAHSTANVTCLAVQVIDVEYIGYTAHASAAPWEGINAFDAAHLAYANISALRQQIKPDHRVHGVIVGPGDLAANVIPDHTQMKWCIRAPTSLELDVLRERIVNCFKAAALATGCKLSLSIGRAALDLRPNSVLAQTYGETAQNRYRMGYTSEGTFNASTDFGNVTYVLPSLHPTYTIPTEKNGGNHTPGFTRSAATKEAHEETLYVAQALALTGFRVLDDSTFCKEAWKTFHKEMNKLP